MHAYLSVRCWRLFSLSQSATFSGVQSSMRVMATGITVGPPPPSALDPAVAPVVAEDSLLCLAAIFASNSLRLCQKWRAILHYDITTAFGTLKQVTNSCLRSLSADPAAMVQTSPRRWSRSVAWCLWWFPASRQGRSGAVAAAARSAYVASTRTRILHRCAQNRCKQRG